MMAPFRGRCNDYYGNAPTSYLWYRLAQQTINRPASGFVDLTNGNTIAPANNPINPGFGDVKDLPMFNTNMVDVLWGSATSTQHNLSLAGRSEKAGYRVSLGYLNDGSLLQWGENSNKRYNMRFTSDYEISNKVKLETNVSLEKNDITQPTLISSVLGQYAQPGFPVSTIDGKPYAWGTQYSSNWQAELGGENKDYTTRVYTNLRLSYQIAKNLSLVGQAGYNWTSEDIKEQQKAIQWYNYLGDLQYPDNPTRQNTYYQRELQKTAYTNLNAYMNYAKVFAARHDVSLTLGTSYERNEYNFYRTRTTNLANDNVPSLNLGVGDATTKSNTEGQNHYALGSFFGRANYAYNERYLLEFNARYDGSSRFIAEDRWKFFAGVSGGWRISEEAFLKDKFAFLNELKLRGSYGVVGNGTGAGIGLYDYIQLLNVTSTSGQTSSGFPIIGAGPAVIVAPTNSLVSLDRTWERVENTNVGFDVSFLNRRLSASADYFVKHNRNMLVQLTYPGTLGVAAPATNDAHLRVWGWEGTLQWQDKIGSVGYRFGGTISENQNKLISYGGRNVINPGFNALVEGYPLNSYFGLEYAGRIQTAEQQAAAQALATGSNLSVPLKTSAGLGGVRIGDNSYKDLNGDGKLTAPEDLKYLGRDDPRYTFAVNVGADWKGFDFTAIFQGVGERTIFREGNWRVPYGSIFQGQTDFWVGKTWTPENTGAYYPILSAGQNGTTYNTYNYQISSWSVQNGTYLRLKNLVLGYTLPQALTKRIGSDRVRIYYSGSDLWEATRIKDGWDPESSRAVGRITNSSTSFERYPFYRLHTVGVNLTF
jgi:TonB-linked SusC/RagA family outer membrane protein